MAAESRGQYLASQPGREPMSREYVMHTRIVTVLLLVLIVIGGSLALMAQESRGTIVGKITDPTGAVVPGA